MRCGSASQHLTYSMGLIEKLAWSPTEMEKKTSRYQPQRCSPTHFSDPFLKTGDFCPVKFASTAASISSLSRSVR